MGGAASQCLRWLEEGGAASLCLRWLEEGKLLSHCGTVHGAVTVVLIPWTPPTQATREGEIESICSFFFPVPPVDFARILVPDFFFHACAPLARLVAEAGIAGAEAPFVFRPLVRGKASDEEV